MSDSDDVRILRLELRELFDRIQTIRQEIASIRRPGEQRDRFATMSDELDAIVDATETATNTIMENAEAIDDRVRTARTSVEDPALTEALDAIPNHIGSIFEACSFQDITGQRITKVVKTLQYIEQRVNALIHIWGESELSDVKTHADDEDRPDGDESHLLNGPQLAGHGVSQSDVDAILGHALPEGGEVPDLDASQVPPDTDDTTPPSAASPSAKATPKPRTGVATPSPHKDKGGPSGMDQSDIDNLFD
ncbi:protein phosphatase CheZ [Roseospira marina]|uniref:Protein phosphatase CheZ n=1 Tax=Roseospira marina TaxID=140057 RepID=A0A5M6IG10_9PROT|nr:protein phosphatase CheZ [Roseospira marina]KAA5606689.1 protein phosphatase CheZ [Roseospira marina]MBB4313898.1 hypothetical protein [Roseospira marina]MBB5087060.1 chemotaxis regulatin CheY-phosphate phosphatase CheZ [Roseospira marina]